jgi:hypothetical protein
LRQPLFLDRIVLDDCDDVFLEVTADVAKPPGKIRRGGAKSGAALTASLLFTVATGLVVGAATCVFIFLSPNLSVLASGDRRKGEPAAAWPPHFAERFPRVLAEGSTASVSVVPGQRA